MKRWFLLVIGMVLLLTACAPSAQAAPKEYRLYEQVLRSYKVFGYERFVVLEETFPGTEMQSTDALMKSLSGDLKDLQEETVADFIAVNEKPSSLAERFDDAYKVELISQAGLTAQVGDPVAWEKFNQKYPVSPGIITFSRAGFNKNGSQALVYFTLVGANQVNEIYFFMFTKMEGKWKISAHSQMALQ